MLNTIQQWLTEHAYLSVWMVGFSLVTLLVSVLVLPYFIAAIPDDYFIKEHGPSGIRKNISLLALLSLSVKNCIGVILILAGLAMLILPGQGVLTLLVGLVLTNFPGKHRLVRKVIAQPKVLAAVNWLRRRRHKNEFKLT